jgi:hypothetical protein
MKRRKLTAEETAMNQAVVESLRRNELTCPTLADIATDELLAPGSKAILHSRSKRAWMLNKHADKWQVKLTRKLDRLDFPELTQGTPKLTNAKQLGRRMAITNSRCSPAEWEQLKASRVGTSVAARILDAVWRMDGKFLTDLGNSLTPPSPARKVYKYLLDNRREVERCAKPAEILKLIKSHGLNYEPGSFYRLCKQIGLPVSQG